MKYDTMMYMKTVTLKNVIWKEGKFYVAQCLNVDISSFGKTKKEALANIHEALVLYFENTKKPTIQKISEPSVVETSLKYA